MIIYQASKDQFIHHAMREDIEEVVARHFRSATGHGVSPSEIRSWKESLQEMSKVLQDEDIPGDVGIGIEYQVPRTSKRIDFIIAAEDKDGRAKVVIVELKQWSTSRRWVRPFKMLADSVVGLLQGHPEFVLIDEQKLVQESVLAAEKPVPSSSRNDSSSRRMPSSRSFST